jgi:hypothetical protein
MKKKTHKEEFDCIISACERCVLVYGCESQQWTRVFTSHYPANHRARGPYAFLTLSRHFIIRLSTCHDTCAVHASHLLKHDQSKGHVTVLKDNNYTNKWRLDSKRFAPLCPGCSAGTQTRRRWWRVLPGRLRLLTSGAFNSEEDIFRCPKAS